MNERETAAGDVTCAEVSPDDLSSVQVGTHILPLCF